MNDNYSDLVNNYIDKELSKDDIDKVHQLINSDNEFKTIISIHNYVHETLAEIPQKQAPLGITDLIMAKIVTPISEKYRKNYLFRVVVSMLAMILIFTLFFFFHFLGELSFVKSAAESTGNYTNVISSGFKYIAKILNTEIFRTASGIIGFIVLIGFYFSFNSHKSIKETLNKF